MSLNGDCEEESPLMIKDPQDDDQHWQKYKCELDESLIVKAKDELNEKPEWRERDIQALRDMISSHPGLRCPMDDQFLLRFLRARKFDYDRAYLLLLSYYQVRADYKHILGPTEFQLLPSDLNHVWKSGVTMLLPQRDANGRAILYFRPGKWDPSSYPIQDILRANLINLEKAVMDEETQISGIVMVGDFSGLGLSQAKHFERSYAKILTSLIQEAFPLRFKALYILNEPAAFRMIVTILKPFLKEKFADRLHFIGSNHQLLLEELGADFLPKDIGGGLFYADTLAQEWHQIILKDEPLFAKMCTYGFNGSKTTYLTKPNKVQSGCCLYSCTQFYYHIDIDLTNDSNPRTNQAYA